MFGSIIQPWYRLKSNVHWRKGAKTHKSRTHSGQLWLPRSRKLPLTKARKLHRRRQYFILWTTATLWRELNVRSTVNQTFPTKRWVTVWLHVWVGPSQWLHWHSTFCEATLMVSHWSRHCWCICSIDIHPSGLLIQGFKLSWQTLTHYDCFLSNKRFTHSSQVRFNVSGVWCMMPVDPRHIFPHVDIETTIKLYLVCDWGGGGERSEMAFKIIVPFKNAENL